MRPSNDQDDQVVPEMSDARPPSPEQVGVQPESDGSDQACYVGGLFLLLQGAHFVELRDLMADTQVLVNWYQWGVDALTYHQCCMGLPNVTQLLSSWAQFASHCLPQERCAFINYMCCLVSLQDGLSGRMVALERQFESSIGHASVARFAPGHRSCRSDCEPVSYHGLYHP